ncbi:MAG: nucleotidyltransferase family protein [Planctomycetota bacterium]
MPDNRDRSAAKEPAPLLPHLDACAASVQISSALEEVTSHFSAQGVDCVAIKGAALLQTVYRDDPWQRSMVDADVMVLPHQLEDACGELERLGFTRTPGEQSNYSRQRGATHVRIDLHEGLWYLDPGALRDFWRRAFVPEKSRLRVPAPEDHMLLTAVHAVVLHGQLRPTWLEDLARLSSLAIDWAKLSHRARSLRLQVPVYLALQAVAAAGTRIPSFVLRDLQPSGLDRLRAGFLKWCLRRPEAPQLGHVLRLIVPGRGPSCVRRLASQLAPRAEFLQRRYPNAGSARRGLQLRLLRPYWTLKNLAALLWRVASPPAPAQARRSAA